MGASSEPQETPELIEAELKLWPTTATVISRPDGKRLIQVKRWGGRPRWLKFNEKMIQM